MLKFNAKGAISGLGLSLIQLLLLATLPLPSVEAQTPCSSERVRTFLQDIRGDLGLISIDQATRYER